MLSLNIYLTGKILFICIDVTENANCKFIIHHYLITVSGKFHQYIDKYEVFDLFFEKYISFSETRTSFKYANFTLWRQPL